LWGNNTYLKQTTSSCSSTGTNGAWVSCGFALCMIDFCHWRMSARHFLQLGHFVVFPSHHASGAGSRGSVGRSSALLLPPWSSPHTLWNGWGGACHLPIVAIYFSQPNHASGHHYCSFLPQAGVVDEGSGHGVSLLEVLRIWLALSSEQ